MNPIYQFTWNFKSYRSTDMLLLNDFAVFLGFIGKFEAVGESDTEIQLERV